LFFNVHSINGGLEPPLDRAHAGHTQDADDQLPARPESKF